MPGGVLGNRRELWLGTSQSRSAKHLPPASRICHSRKGAQVVAGYFWRELGLLGEDGGSSMKKNKAQF